MRMHARMFLDFWAVILALTATFPVLSGELNQGVSGIPLTELFPDARFEHVIPTQQAVTGVEPGKRPLRPDEVVNYFKVLDEASPSARLIEFGRSYEGRPLVVLAIGDPKLLGDLEGFRARHQALLNGKLGVSTAAELAGEKPVAWLAYGIHGDEISSTDAAAAVAYRLLAGTDELSVLLREKLLVMIDPCENPDGRARFLAMTTSFAHREANPDLEDLSHSGVWPWGRGNHYLFDMNRDWFTMLMPESVRSREIAAWLPQMVVDSHEMGANESYLFPMPRQPFNPWQPTNSGSWGKKFSQEQAQALDRRGYPYFAGEWNEEFFPGYGSSWASYQGAIGILYEMSGTNGTLVRKHNGTLRTFAQAVEHQATSTMANLRTLVENSAEILADQIAIRRLAVSQGEQGLVGAWVFPNARNPDRLKEFAALLQAQGIEVLTLKEGKGSAKLNDARTGKIQDVALTRGSLCVPMSQPAGFLARVLLDPHVPMNAAFFQEEREYLEKGKESQLYDTTAWSLPLLRGLPAYWGAKVPVAGWQAWEAEPEKGKGSLELAESNYYVLDGDRDNTPALLAALLRQGIKVRVAEKPFAIAGQSFQRGALVLQREGNGPNLRQVLSELAGRFAVSPHAVDTAKAEQGPDLGGSHYPVLIEPRVGVVSGMPVSPTDYGFVWHLLDQGMNLRFSALDVSNLKLVDLARYNLLIFPPLLEGSYSQLLGEEGLARLQNWVEGGGTAIGFGEGAELFTDKKWALTTTRFRHQVLEEYPTPVWSIPAWLAEAAGRPTAVGMRVPDESKRSPGPEDKRSPYDVAPVLGPGAEPFAKGHEQGTPLRSQVQLLDQWLAPILPQGQKEPSAADREQADERLRRLMPQGVLLRAQLDETFWLNYGLPGEITVWFGSDDSLIAAPPADVAASFVERERLHLGGLLWPEAAARLARTAYAVCERVGRGQVILFADHPGYRRWMLESERQLQNAILLGPGLGTDWSTPW